MGTVKVGAPRPLPGDQHPTFPAARDGGKGRGVVEGTGPPRCRVTPRAQSSQTEASAPRGACRASSGAAASLDPCSRWPVGICSSPGQRAVPRHCPLAEEHRALPPRLFPTPPTATGVSAQAGGAAIQWEGRGSWASPAPQRTVGLTPGGDQMACGCAN